MTRCARRSSAIVLAAALVLCACGKDTTAPPSVASVSVTPATATLQVGQTLQLTASTLSSSGATLTGHAVSWSSFDATIATVSATGLATALKPASVTITATSEGKTGTATLTVTPGALATVRLTLRDTVIVMGKTTTATAALLDSAGNAISNVPVTYTSSDTTIAVAGTSGTITGAYEGTVTIRATANGKTGSASLRVLLDPTMLSAYWKLVPDAFDMSPYLSATGGASLIQLAADVNRDGKQDIVFHFWHMRTVVEATLPLNAPVPNRLAVFLSNGDGTFRDGTVAAFGRSDVDVAGAVTRFVRAYDLNGDGYPDWVYATNREDSRPSGKGNWVASSAAVLSQGNGTYRVVVFGDANYHHGIAVVPVGSDIDIVTSGRREDMQGHLGNEAYAFAGGVFSPVNSYPSVGFMPSVPLSLTLGANTTHLLFDKNLATEPTPLVLAKRSGTRSWTETDSLSFAGAFERVNWYGWNGDYCEKCQFLWHDNGEDFLTLAYIDGCSLQLQPRESPVAVLSRNSLHILGGARGRTTFREGEGMEFYNHVMAFSIVGDHLSPLSLIADSDQPTHDQYTDMECRDVNDDGYGDLVVYSLGKPPRIFLNDHAGRLRRVPDQLLPPSRVEGGGGAAWQGMLLDVDGDGILDLTFFPRGYCSAGSACATMQIWKGRRPLPLPSGTRLRSQAMRP